uniref:Gag-like protein n=2 Tax=Monascus pilosus TaxID=89488 RepID=Q2PWB5_MONPI|nr:gag-like protein [Monascus pilosus]
MSTVLAAQLRCHTTSKSTARRRCLPNIPTSKDTTYTIAPTLHLMEVDDPPAVVPCPRTASWDEKPDPPLEPTTPLHRNTHKRRALSSLDKMPGTLSGPILSRPNMLSIRQQINAVAEDQLLLLNDWRQALTSLADALNSTVSSLHGWPKELAKGLAARFLTLAKGSTPQLGPEKPPIALPKPTPEPVQAKQATPAGQTTQAPSWSSVVAPGPDQKGWQATRPKPAKQPQQARRMDNRIFLRLPEPSNLREIGPHGIRIALTGRVPRGISCVQIIPTGYAITTTDEGKAFLLSAQAKELAADGHFEMPIEYHQFVVPQIPQRLWSLEGWTETTLEDISTEAEHITGIKPCHIKLSNHPTEVGSITAVIAFPKKPKFAIQLFGISGLSRPICPKQRPLQCSRCHHFHDTRACRSNTRCISCGSTKIEHTCRVQCINCHGPHAADYPKCPAQPISRKGTITHLSKEALAAIRKAGRLAFQQQARKVQAAQASPHTLNQAIDQPSRQLSQELASQTSPEEL